MPVQLIDTAGSNKLFVINLPWCSEMAAGVGLQRSAQL